jgi:Flp pilus assembly protein TadG
VTKLLGGDAGTALVEFALVMPVVLMLLVGVIDVARAANAYTTLSSAAREGSHYAALHPTAAPAAITDVVRARVQPLDAGSVTVEASYHDGSAFVAWPSGGIPASSPRASSVPARVRVTYPWEAVTSLIGRSFTGASFSASSTADAIR